MGTPIRRLTQESGNPNVVKLTHPVASAKNITLQGWKEIAAELGRSVRTVQRWEQALKLPVHKLGTGDGSPVFAFKDELHSWLRTTADDRKNTKMAPLPDSELSVSGRRPPAKVKARQNFQSPIASEPEIIRSLNAFFALRRVNNNSSACSRCHASTRHLIGHFWLYGTDRTWQVSVPFCPNCDSELRAMLPPLPEHIS